MALPVALAHLGGTCYVPTVIKSFRDKRSAAVFAGLVPKSWSRSIARRAYVKLLMLEVAGRLEDLRAPPGNRLEALKDERRGSTASGSTSSGASASSGVTGMHMRSRSPITTKRAAEGDEPILRDALDTGRVDLCDVVDSTAEPLSLATPGQILQEEFLEPLGLSARRAAQAIGVPHNRLTAIINGQRSISADTALRLGIYFGTTPEFWLSLQAGFELRKVRAEIGDRLRREITPNGM